MRKSINDLQYASTLVAKLESRSEPQTYGVRVRVGKTRTLRAG